MTTLYELSHPLEMNVLGFITETKYVVVGVKPHDQIFGLMGDPSARTTVFAANKNGSLFGGFWDRNSDDPDDHTYVERVTIDDGELAFGRVFGAYDHEQALSQLGYNLSN